MHFPLCEEVSAPDIKWGREDIRLNSSNLPIQTKTFKSPHTFARPRNVLYSSYRNANKIEIPFLKLSMPAASQSMGDAVPYLRDDLAGTPLRDVQSAAVLSLLLGAGQGQALSGTKAPGLTQRARTLAWRQRRGKVAPTQMGRREGEGDQLSLCYCHPSRWKDPTPQHWERAGAGAHQAQL